MRDRYFLDSDSDGHWYVVPEDLEAAWQEWNSLPDHDERGWNSPDGVIPVNGWPGLVRFYKPAICTGGTS